MAGVEPALYFSTFPCASPLRGGRILTVCKEQPSRALCKQGEEAEKKNALKINNQKKAFTSPLNPRPSQVVDGMNTLTKNLKLKTNQLINA